jgi:hypothetical protein
MRPLPWVTTGRQTEKEESSEGCLGPRQKIGEDPFPNLVHRQLASPRKLWNTSSHPTLGDVECPLCLEVLVRPLQLPCSTSCVCAWVQHTCTITLLHPVTCLGVLDTTQIMAAPSVLLKLLESLQEVWEESSWSSKWGGVGFGVMGEQGAESIHAEFNKNRAKAPKPAPRPRGEARRVVTEHILKSLPSHVAAQPPYKAQEDRSRVTATHTY